MRIARLAFTGSLNDSVKVNKNGLSIENAKKIEFEKQTQKYKNYVLTAVKYDSKRDRTYFVLSKGQNKRTEQIPFKFFNIDESVENAIKIFGNLFEKLEKKIMFLR